MEIAYEHDFSFSPCPPHPPFCGVTLPQHSTPTPLGSDMLTGYSLQYPSSYICVGPRDLGDECELSAFFLSGSDFTVFSNMQSSSMACPFDGLFSLSLKQISRFLRMLSWMFLFYPYLSPAALIFFFLLPWLKMIIFYQQFSLVEYNGNFITLFRKKTKQKIPQFLAVPILFPPPFHSNHYA